jgi:hypothetical protein
MIETDAPGTLSPTQTLLVVAFVLMALGIGFAWALYSWRLQRQRAALVLASVTAGTPPARGHVVLHGTVETEEPDRPAITVTLWEHGEEQEGKNGWTHTWTEQRRETKAEPFYLALTGSPGIVVRVEPHDDVFLVDKLDALHPGNPRTRRAELTNGEEAYVSGLIGRGWHARTDARQASDTADIAMASAARGSAYRGGPTEGLVLRAGRDRMLVSTEPLELRYVRQARAHRLFAIVLGLAFVVASTLDFGSTVVTELFGKTVDAEITAVRHWTTKAKSSVNHHYSVTARYTDEAGHVVVLTDAARVEIYEAFQAKRISRVPFVVAFDNPTFSCLGVRATTDAGRAIVSVFLTLVLALLYRAALGGAREWYDKPRVITRGDGRI